MLFTILFCLLAVEESVPYYVVLKSKKIMTVKEAPDCQDRLCKVTLLNGQVISMPSKLIDTVESERYNNEKAEKREQKRLAEEADAAAKEKTRAKHQAWRKKQHVAITIDDALPKFERGSNTRVSDTQDASEVPTGESRVNNYTSQEAVYVARETITPFSDHYDVEIQLKVSSTKGVTEVKLKLKVNYENDAADVIEKSIPGKLAFQETAILHFRLEKTDSISRTSHEVYALIEE